MEFDKSLTITLTIPLESMTLIVPPLLDPTKIFPASLSAICLGVSIFSANISILKPNLQRSFLDQIERLEVTSLNYF